jgi:hypothetical protein
MFYTGSSTIHETDNGFSRGRSSAGVSPQYGNRKIRLHIPFAVFPSVYMSARKDSKATEEAFMKNAVGDLL